MPDDSVAPGAPEPDAAPGRPVAPGGWRRAIVGLVIGLLAGAAVAALLPRERGPRRTRPLAERPRPFDD